MQQVQVRSLHDNFLFLDRMRAQEEDKQLECVRTAQHNEELFRHLSSEIKYKFTELNENIENNFKPQNFKHLKMQLI